MKSLNCKIRTIIRIPLDENIEEEREIMSFSPLREKEIEQWNDGILIEVQPVTSKYISDGYHNEQTVFNGIVWDSTDLQIKTLPLNAIQIEEREIDRMMRKQWN